MRAYHSKLKQAPIFNRRATVHHNGQPSILSFRRGWFVDDVEL
jgi:hypothetical protein